MVLIEEFFVYFKKIKSFLIYTFNTTVIHSSVGHTETLSDYTEEYHIADFDFRFLHQ